MQRVPSLTIEQAQGKAKDLLTAAKKAVGKELNIYAAFANAPAALDGLMHLNGALSHGVLPAKFREQLALTVAGANACGYCASAHTFLAEKAGVAADERAANLTGVSADTHTNAGLKFANQLVENRGHVTEDQVAAARAAGYSNEQLIEILAHVALNTFTNYFNEAFKTKIDFPVVAVHAHPHDA